MEQSGGIVVFIDCKVIESSRSKQAVNTPTHASRMPCREVSLFIQPSIVANNADTKWPQKGVFRCLGMTRVCKKLI